MMQVISRDLISENFNATNLLDNFFPGALNTTKVFSKKKLISKINFWKYILTYRCNSQAGESVLIGFVNIDIDYIAVCFAAAELSLVIVIVDYARPDEFTDVDFFDPKTKLLSPIDIFLHDVPKGFLNEQFTKRHKFFVSCSVRSYSIADEIDFSIERTAYRKVRKILPKPDDILMRCTSSGTTGTPKIIEHTHEFLHKLTIRNSKKFKGQCVHTANLNHGSSLAVYFLPAFASEQVTQHLLYQINPVYDFAEALAGYCNTLEFVIFPYPFMIEKFINSSKDRNIKWPLLNVQTLSYIQDNAKDAIKQNIIKSITSIFGSNETSGPVFEASINLTNLHQSPKYFVKLDDFYRIKIYKDNLLSVTLPVYDKEIITNDLFEETNDFYIHKGRTDLVKINGEIVDIKIVNSINTKDEKFYVITDSVKNCLYLACWINVPKPDVDYFVKEVEYNFKRIPVSKIAVLNKQSFFSGIKLDNELLREYFRNYV
jgi:hypothetical protein